MPTPEKLQKAFDSLSVTLEMDAASTSSLSIPAQGEQQDALLKLLEKQVAYLLDRDFERLLQVFYRLDVPEHKVKKVFSGDSPEIAHEFAKLILQREIQRIETREKYS